MSRAAPHLGSVHKYAVLAATTVTSTGPTSVKGLLDVCPGTAITGFPPGEIDECGLSATASIAQLDLKKAYDDAAGRPVPHLLSGNLGGMTLGPGVYRSTDGLEVSSGDLTLDGAGDEHAVFIFQVASTLMVTDGLQMSLVGGARAQNVFWQLGSSATFNTGAHVIGNVMAYASITCNTGACVQGRLLALNGAVTLDSNVVTAPE